MFWKIRRKKAQEQREKEHLFIQFYHEKYNLLTDRYLSDPTPDHIASAKRIIHFLDSQGYMLQKSWLNRMSLSGMKDHLMMIDRVLAQVVHQGENDG